MSEEAAPLVRVRNLTREFISRRGLFGERRAMKAVDNVTLDVPVSQVTGVVGESGCGKSTLARLVLRLIEASSGSVTFENSELGSLPPRELRQLRRRMQMVFQDPYSSLDPRYTIADALLEPYAIQGVRLSRAEKTERVAELLATVGLSAGAASSYPHQLSGGQKQRISIARAIISKPQILIFDDCLSAVDVETEELILNNLKTIMKDKTTIIISHRDSALRNADKVIEL